MLQEIGREVLALARAGLRARHRLDSRGMDETHFLDPLDAILASGETHAESMLKRFHGSWNGSVEPVFEECAY
jgi:glutamate--cysteine ligase